MDDEIESARGVGGRLTGIEAAASSAGGLAAVVLVLHGGRVRSDQPVRRTDLAVLRMRALARSVQRSSSLPVLALRYRLRGWNDHDGARTPPPVHDALMALEEVERRLGPVPVILVGHSLGGRVAVRMAGYPTVRAVAALAPWLPLDEPVETLDGRTVLIAHGREDRVTDVEHSIDFAARAAVVADAVYVKVLDDGHAMLRSATAWHRLVADFAALVAFGTSGGGFDADLLGAP